jgi:hypothetical protein
VAPGLALGGSDYAGFVRRQVELHAPAQDGAIELGPGHAHVELDPLAPPAGERFAAIAADALERAADRDAARERWRVGSGYRGVELASLLARPLGEPLALLDAARAVVAAHAALDECGDEAAASLAVAPHSSGYERVTLAAATRDEALLIMASLADALGGTVGDRLAFVAGKGGRGVLGRVLSRRPAGEERTCALPSTFADGGPRTEALLAAWRRYVGAAHVVEADGGPAAYETLVRGVWV